MKGWLVLSFGLLMGACGQNLETQSRMKSAFDAAPEGGADAGSSIPQSTTENPSGPKSPAGTTERSEDSQPVATEESSHESIQAKPLVNTEKKPLHSDDKGTMGEELDGKMGSEDGDKETIDSTSQRFSVSVDGGFGSGTYAPGETVYVWSAASPQSEVAMPWSGDATLLRNPKEWLSHFVMPSRDVTLTSNSKKLPIKLTLERFGGETGRNKTIRYFFPAEVKGLVIISHGTGGSSAFIEKPETFALALALVNRGFAVLSTESEESVAGDLNRDGKERWNTRFEADNVDLKNISLILSSLEQRGLLSSSTPLFALGMSNGGAFSHFLGAVSSSRVASDFPKIRFKAIVGYCADALQVYKNSPTATPSAWYMCGQDDHPEVSNTQAMEIMNRLQLAGVQTDYAENQATPVCDERFSRIEGISHELSKSIVAELRAAQFLDAKGFLARPSEEIVEAIITSNDAKRFGKILSLTREQQLQFKTQLKVLRAEHSHYSDLSMRNILFFEKFL